MPKPEREGPIEIPLVGDLTRERGRLVRQAAVGRAGRRVHSVFRFARRQSLLRHRPDCRLILLRGLKATGVVAGECSSAALWPFAACARRLVTPLSVLLFHPMKWQSEENVGLGEAAEWARHFAQLETDMDRLLAELFGCPPETIERWVRRTATSPAPSWPRPAWPKWSN